MGKLHKLRRAIEQDPDRWTTDMAMYHRRPSVPKWMQPTGAYYSNYRKEWIPDWYIKSYKQFVRKVLKELSADDGPDRSYR